MLDRGAESDPGESHEATRQLGVKESCRPETHLGETPEVLCGGVQDPFDVSEGVCDGSEVGAHDWVDEPGASPLATQLDEVGPLAVAMARSAFGVNRDRSMSTTQGSCSRVKRALVLDDIGHTLGRG